MWVASVNGLEGYVDLNEFFFSVSWHTSIESIFVCRLGCCVRELLGGKDP